MNYHIKYCLSIFNTALLFVLILFNTAHPQQLPDNEKIDLSTAINLSAKTVINFMRQNKVPGMSAAVAKNGKILWSEGFGFADLENGVPATKFTKFRIGSVSKVITSAALGKLYEKGLVDLDAEVQKYLPSFPEKRWPITIRQVASHQAGIRHYNGDEFLNTNHYDSVIDGLEIFKDDTLLFEPGTDFSYSSYGWNLISAVIEKASGIKFLNYMQNQIFDPAQMNSIVADHNDSLISHRASYYYLSDDGVVLNSIYVDNSNKWAGGGFISNSEDLVKFGLSILANDIITNNTLKLFQKPRVPSNGQDRKYGLGWASGVDEFGHKWYGHSGGSMGGRAMFIIYPEDKIVVALLTNLGPAQAPVKESQKIADIFRKIKP
jgi:serine beta-lactamase-like protein LACTB